ncbi:Pyruvate, phosphate dikinase, chloroplastic [Artemisia annua]|uniref:Pyruvate, phosphate dikinase, chloroplastic n=1 Tax=Artemisia annua TaxID=35608 RepID=A0A2U1Q138_ARTAN|nr:Pyruvate, phosphate dikinase, chloroplastic [Artemisia annua]
MAWADQVRLSRANADTPNVALTARNNGAQGIGLCRTEHMHGREPSSVAYFDGAGQDYVSCSPFRVPIARLAAAQLAV